MDPINTPKIVFLSGPSSSGKTHATKALDQKKWARLEADAERPHVEVALLKTALLDKLTYFQSHFENHSPDSIRFAIGGEVQPRKPPTDPIHFEKVRIELKNLIDEKNGDVTKALLIHMLDKAIDLSLLGKSVILDHVPFVNEGYFSSKEVTPDPQAPNLWCYKNVKIEQQLKYVPVEVLMRNVMRRNQNTDEYRPMIMVLKQFAERFTVAKGKDVHLGTLKVESLKKWIERAEKIDFFEINPDYVFKLNETNDIDKLIEHRLKQFQLQMEDPDSQNLDEIDVKTLKEKKLEYPHLQEKIDATTKKMMEVMGISEAATEVNLTYFSTGIKPTVITD